MNDHADALDQITRRLNALEEHLDALEQRMNTLAALDGRAAALEHPPAASWPQPVHEPDEIPAPGATAAAGLALSGSIFAVLGRAMLGIAGAYLLRAVAEAGSLPQLAVAWAGIVYAFLWLAGAARSRAASQLPASIYACTSALILAPMLGELTLRFKLMPAAVTAGVLCGYALAALGLAAKWALAPVLRVGVLTAAGLAVALDVASHDTLPFIAVLLVLSALAEFVPPVHRLPELRFVVALAADTAIWTLIFVYFSTPSARTDYPQLGRSALLVPGLTVFLISAAGVILQAAVRRKQIAIFSIIQTTIAFLLAAVSLADFGPSSSSMILSILCLILSAACWLAVFLVFAGQSERRNFNVFAAWSAALLLCGCLLCFAPQWTAVCLSASAVAAISVSRVKSWPVFEFYGIVFLLAAAAESGLLSFLVSALVLRPAGAPAAVAVFVIVAAILCYAALQPHPGEPWKRQALHLAFAALSLGSVAALAVQAMVSLIALKVIPGAHHVAFIRTLTLCFAALALVFSGSRWRRRELTRLGYATLVLVAIKLVAEDLRHGHLAYIAGSIFLFAVTLIAAPRAARVRQRA